jgi:hypothetical protein
MAGCSSRLTPLPQELFSQLNICAMTNQVMPHPSATNPTDTILTLGEIDLGDVVALLAAYGLAFELIPEGAAIPGSFWGDSEAGLIGRTVYARRDTPVHSLLHEACHLIVLPAHAQAQVHTNATDSQEEEDAVCVLQALLGDALPGVGRDRVLADMDAWGYSFRLGSARAYVEQDAESSWRWLAARGLVDAQRRVLASLAGC